MLERSRFNFDTNETLTAERIIRATFANPDRRKFAQNNCYNPLYPDNIDPEALIQRITTEMPRTLQKFTEQKIQLYDTSRLKPEVNKTQWLADLKKLKWYGPFDSKDTYYRFQTATDSGNFEGLLLYFSLHEKHIFLFFLDKNSNPCGSYYSFWNN